MTEAHDTIVSQGENITVSGTHAVDELLWGRSETIKLFRSWDWIFIKFIHMGNRQVS